jgi:hypothetical protein
MVILVDVDGSAMAVRGGVKHSARLHNTASRAHAPCIVFVLIQAFGANPCGRCWISHASQEAKFKLAIFFYCIVHSTSSQNKKYTCKNNFYEKIIVLSSSIYFYCIEHTNSSLIKNYILVKIFVTKKKQLI